MSKKNEIPLRDHPLVDQRGRLTPTWQRWFAKVLGSAIDDTTKLEDAAIYGIIRSNPNLLKRMEALEELISLPQANNLSRISREVITGPWAIQQYQRVYVNGANYTMTRADYGKLIIMNIGASDFVCTIPAGELRDVDRWLHITRVGTGKLTILAQGTDIIMDGLAGSWLECSNTDYVYQKIGLIQLAEGEFYSWLGSFGVFDVY